ncbi:hypothetical protein K2173_006703 [Erythroxylum novogranatense]|uniref:Uncharacterized protein n=1 Tax=Erythroxylum novogranatense TaxID=1862640 RepID=A0AAV8TCS8_9ROSI|nr:hypothetical protein K2173_006703 [Erythroxylum novogranatense]
MSYTIECGPMHLYRPLEWPVKAPGLTMYSDDGREERRVSAAVFIVYIRGSSSGAMKLQNFHDASRVRRSTVKYVTDSVCGLMVQAALTRGIITRGVPIHGKLCGLAMKGMCAVVIDWKCLRLPKKRVSISV